MADELGKFLFRHQLSIKQMFPESIHEIDSFVAHTRQFLSISSQSEPLLFFVPVLAITRLGQYILSRQGEVHQEKPTP